jgi:hypothetical protein
MKRRTRHALMLLVLPILMVLVFGGWIISAIRRPLTLRDDVVVSKRVRHTGPKRDPIWSLSASDE